MSEAVNQVDVSQETIDAEWARIGREHSVGSEPELNFSDVEGVEVVGDAGAGGGMPAGVVQESFDERVDAAKMVINAALVFAFEALGSLNISSDQYDKVSHGWAVVIAKRFDGGIFDFMARYKDELSALAATVVFLGVVREGYQKKAEAKRQETIAKNRAKASSQAGDSENEEGVSDESDAA